MTELAVLVPVLARPQNVKPLVESFWAECPDNSALVFLATAGDEEEIHASEEWNYPGPDKEVWTWVSDAVTWPQKINEGIEYLADWYLFAADDITFTPGWWEATKELRDESHIGVIGTNDSSAGMGNPRVAAGEHTCHPLVRAQYVREFGTADQRNLAVHPGYHHWFVDDELVTTAKLRGAWAFCREAVLEHHHPYWDKTIPWDETYAKGEANHVADMELWRYRAEHVLGLTIQ